ncbi:5-histidylcysteine sulfoxide synthase/putative 4-mercaptohistidine N1-methyltransferase [Oxalobacteraceae bacterium GrIS 1.11]
MPLASPTESDFPAHGLQMCERAPPDPLAGERPAWWWAGGAAPQGNSPGMRAEGKLASLPMPNLASCTRAEVMAYFRNGWLLSEVLFGALQGGAAFLQAPHHQLRHPLIFYYGHSACFFMNRLRAARLIEGESINAYFESIFAVGVDEMSWDDMSKNTMPWPEVREVADYRRAAHARIEQLIATHPGLRDGHAIITRADPLWALFMALEHERIHLETSSVLMREMPLALLRQPAAWPEIHPSAAQRGAAPDGMVRVEGAELRIGKQSDDAAYGWDNEYGTRLAKVASFEMSPCMVTNGQFLAFVEAGGYRERAYWSDEGWRWRAFRDAQCPPFWIAGEGGYRLRTIFHVIDFAPLWPVCVNFHEAKAYLAWQAARDGRAYRLPTEAEYTLLRGAGDAGASLHLAHGSERSVLASAPNAAGVRDIGGNLWDWCEDDFHPLDGFKVHPHYDDFSTPCFDGEHAMILGGSFISTGNEASPTARFHFRRHFFQHAGFHAVLGDAEASGAIRLRGAADNKYESRATLDQYLLFHFGRAEDATPAGAGRDLHAFPQRCAAKLNEWALRAGCGSGAVLDIGCAVGGAAFALSACFERVEAIDISAAFIGAAQALRDGAALPYEIAIEGALREGRVARVAPEARPQRVNFRRADACALPPEYAQFDAVLAGNLLCRLPSPRAFLERLGGPHGLLKPGGIVVLASPFSWSENFTTRSAWIGGDEVDGRALRSLDVLADLLAPEFELLHREDFPFMLREHARKYEYVVSDLSVWRRVQR